MFRRRRSSSAAWLMAGGVIAALAGISFLWKPENLVRMKDQDNLIFKLAGGFVSIFPQALQSLIARLFGLGFFCGGSFLVFIGFSAMTEGPSMVTDRDAQRVHLAAEQVELMDDAVAAKFAAYCGEVVAAANAASTDGIRAEMADKRSIRFRDRSEEVVEEWDLYTNFFKNNEPAAKIGKQLAHVVAVENLEATGGAAGPASASAPGGTAQPAGLQPAMPGQASPSPSNATPTPPPGPTEDPRVAAVDRLLDKAAKQWAAGKKDASLMLAEEALKDAEEHLPAGHPKIEEVKKKVEGARAALKAP